MYGGGVVVASITNVIQQDRVQRRISKRIDGFRHTGTSGLDRDVIILVKVNTGMLYGSIFSVTKKFFFDAHVATANDMLSILPSAVAECLTLSLMRFFNPLTATATARRREGAAIAAAAASSIAESAPVATAGRGGRSLGAGPIIPASKSLSGGRVGVMTKITYTTGG